MAGTSILIRPNSEINTTAAMPGTDEEDRIEEFDSDDDMPLLAPEADVDGNAHDGFEPTAEQKRTLRRVSDKLPWGAFIVAIVELCERFAYYGLSGPFQNYISNKHNDPSGNAGAIGTLCSARSLATSMVLKATSNSCSSTNSHQASTNKAPLALRTFSSSGV